MLKLKSPLACVWEITNRCNFFCPHCRAYTESPKESIEIEKAIIAQLIENEVLSVNLSGGEPLLNPRIFDIIIEFTQKNIDVGISTNGYIFKEKASRLFDSGISFVQISIDGPEKFHDSFRGVNGAYSHAIESIKYAKKIGLFVQMNTTINAWNMKYVFENIALAERLGVDRIFFRRVVAAGLASKNKVNPDKTDYINLLKSLIEFKYSNKTNVKISIDDPIVAVLDNIRFDKESICCSAGITSLGIDSKGNVYPCIFARNIIGNLLSESLFDIWNKSKLLERIRNRDIKICSECEYKTSCGGCRGADGILEWDHMCPLVDS
ncbi:MAG: radical SAM protein [Ruminococcus sp.]|nr:radical SAM protein [Ruminococcus sp.]